MNIYVTADAHWGIYRQGRPLVSIPAERRSMLEDVAGKVIVYGERFIQDLPGQQPVKGCTNIIFTEGVPKEIRGAKAFAEPFYRLRKKRAGEDPHVYEESALSEREEMEALRQKAAGPVLALKEALHRGTTARSGSAALLAFLESESFEHCIQLALSLGGDCDTVAAIAGSLAEAHYRIAPELCQSALARLDENLTTLLQQATEALAGEHLWQPGSLERDAPLVCACIWAE